MEPARGRTAVALAVGVVALEFAAAVTAFVSSTLLPVLARDLRAGDHLALLLAGSTIGLFTALPLASRVAAWLGAVRALSVGMAGYLAGSAASALAPSAWVFAAGQFTRGMAGGLLAVFGISAVIRHLEPGIRVKVVALSSAMWIVPSLVGPAATLALERAVGWRWAMLMPVPLVVAGRLLVARATSAGATSAGATGAGDGSARPLGRTLLVPIGVAAMAIASGYAGGWPVTLGGAALALVGVVGLLPPGTGRAARGVPAALAAMALLAFGYVGAQSLVTVLLTEGYRVSLASAAVVLSSAPLAWAVTSLLVPRLVRARGSVRPAVAGLALAATGTAGLAAFTASAAFPAALGSWTVGGVGIGLAYPGLYLLCTTAPETTASETTASETTGPDTPGFGAVDLATAVITAEGFGGLLGGAAGGALLSTAFPVPWSSGTALTVTYTLFAALLALAALTVTRAAVPAPEKLTPQPVR
jgi:MFS family permease